MFTVGFEKIAALNVAEAAKNLAKTKAMSSKVQAGMSAMEGAGKKKSFFSRATPSAATRTETAGSAYSRAAKMDAPKKQINKVYKRLDEQAKPKAPKKPAEAPKPKEKEPEGYVDKAHDWVKKNPLKSTAAGFGAGYVASKLTEDRREQ